jgi:hypothetical protein
MSVFTTKVGGVKVAVVAANVAFVRDIEGKGELNFVSGLQLQTEVGYDTTRRKVIFNLSGAEAEAE